MNSFREGQRWISDSEPELGLGTLIQVSENRITVSFPASGETRLYAADNAPLRRVRFSPGDSLKTHDNRTVRVETVREEAGLLTYAGEGWEVPESQLSDALAATGPQERLATGHIDDWSSYQLRRRTLRYRHWRRQSSVRGFVGGRIDLIPHQLFIAHEVSSRQAPRVLLSDEVGLGKTIEACLILHRLLLSGRIARVLILVPESLVHQWFVEMLRKFNLWLHIFDEERCASIDARDPDANPFSDDQLILCSMAFLAGSPRRAAQALEENWDILVIDEAHHLEWSPEQASREYALVEALGRRAQGLLLLTATPEQVGPESHFARLRLLDPDRYSDSAAFLGEAAVYRPVARIAAKLQSGQDLSASDKAFLKKKFPGEEDWDAAFEALATGDVSARQALLENLVDLHGPGRVIFRNTRATIKGFPSRTVAIEHLAAPGDEEEWLDRFSVEFAVDAGDVALQTRLDLDRDPRTDWLIRLVSDLKGAKTLLICRSKEKALALDEALRRRSALKIALFHEDLTLVQRDRNAAWFADENGAQLLICSEIGSEGRNFQFAHHLVLFDLPLNPELLEQRIGRLDRIGQTHDIRLYVPVLPRSPQDVLSRWYHEGLDAFQSNLEGGHQLLRQFGRQVHDLALEFPAKPPDEAAHELDDLVRMTATARRRLKHELEEGRDRLLELNSFRPEVAQSLVEAIQTADRDEQLETFMLDVFDEFGVRVDELASRTYHLDAAGILTDAFPALPKDGLVATFDRARALAREDVGFLTWDHPMVTGAIDLILGTSRGNSTVALWPAGERGLFLECFFVLETVASPELHVDRFLPATPVRAVIDHQATDVTEHLPEELLDRVLKNGKSLHLRQNSALTRELLPAMLERAGESAANQAERSIQAGLKNMEHALEHEIRRLLTLRRKNAHIRPEEIELLESQRSQLADAIAGARLRLDALCLIWKGQDLGR